jgi:hypothetical protein
VNWVSPEFLNLLPHGKKAETKELVDRKSKTVVQSSVFIQKFLSRN